MTIAELTMLAHVQERNFLTVGQHLFDGLRFHLTNHFVSPFLLRDAPRDAKLFQPSAIGDAVFIGSYV